MKEHELPSKVLGCPYIVVHAWAVRSLKHSLYLDYYTTKDEAAAMNMGDPSNIVVPGWQICHEHTGKIAPNTQVFYTEFNDLKDDYKQMVGLTIKNLNPDVIAFLREQYPRGTRIELIEVKGKYSSLPKGLQGSVRYVDDIGTIHMDWGNGNELRLVFGVDKYKLVEA
jgi:hypothetical protein